MRFDANLSSPYFEFSVNGKSNLMASDTHLGLRAKCKQIPAVAKANLIMSEGVHYWEINCPIYCQQMRK